MSGGSTGSGRSWGTVWGARRGRPKRSLGGLPRGGGGATWGGNHMLLAFSWEWNATAIQSLPPARVASRIKLPHLKSFIARFPWTKYCIMRVFRKVLPVFPRNLHLAMSFRTILPRLAGAAALACSTWSH